MQQCGNHMIGGQEWIHHDPTLVKTRPQNIQKQTYRVSPKDCVTKRIQILDFWHLKTSGYFHNQPFCF
jgi:hypothetical protein